jgi:hypothetical protein
MQWDTAGSEDFQLEATTKDSFGPLLSNEEFQRLSEDVKPSGIVPNIPTTSVRPGLIFSPSSQSLPLVNQYDPSFSPLLNPDNKR